MCHVSCHHVFINGSTYMVIVFTTKFMFRTLRVSGRELFGRLLAPIKARRKRGIPVHAQIMDNT
jgi:hypothetical protein